MPQNEDEAQPLLEEDEANNSSEGSESCGYPTQVFFILGNEFCERFSYYGQHAILVIYLTSMLDMHPDQATAWYHAFNMLCYFTPVIGAMIADSFWGKYKTILILSIVYAIGNVIVSITAIPSILDSFKIYGPAFGLLLIGIGTGGIKPCVSAFGGDQFKDGQDHLLNRFFSMFYFAINVGSLTSMLLTPVLRGDVQCFGDDCYSLAFGVPAILMVVAIILFLAGTSLYRRYPPEGNVVVLVIDAIGTAIKERWNSSSGERKEHWMDWATEKHGEELVSDIKALCKVLFMFIPLPVFWTLFDQQGSRWTLQAIDMNGNIGIFGTLKPDQMQALNPVFVMILIPFCEYIVYPIAMKCHFLTKPLQRMAFGQFLVALSFVWAGFLQMRMDSTMAKVVPPEVGHVNVRLINAVPRTLFVKAPELSSSNITIPTQQATEYFQVPVDQFKNIPLITAEGNTDMKLMDQQLTKFEANNTYSILIASNHSVLEIFQLRDEIESSHQGHAEVRFIHAAACVADSVTVVLNKTLKYPVDPLQHMEYRDIKTGSYNLRVRDIEKNNKRIGYSKQHFDNGGIYTVLIQPNPNGTCTGVHFVVYADVKPASVSILWQAPQYFTITLGEVMFSITGLEFAYSQSPPSMKSCIMAAWLLTVSFGNLIVVILAGLKLTDNMAVEFFCFAAFLTIVTTIFSIMAYFYKYARYGSAPRRKNSQATLAEEEEEEGEPPPDKKSSPDEIRMRELDNEGSSDRTRGNAGTS